MGEYSRSARGVVTSSGGIMAVNTPFEPQVIELLNYTSAAAPATGLVESALWDFDMGQGFAVAQVYGSTGTPPYLGTALYTSGGFSTFSAGISLQYGAPQQIVSATAANPPVFTVTAHGYTTGDVVIFEGLYSNPPASTMGMPQISGIPFAITVTGANTFTIPWNASTSNYTALSGSPNGSFVKKVLYPFLYAPGESVVTAITLGATTQVQTTAPHNLVPGNAVAFRIPTAWGTTQLNSLADPRRPGSPVYGYVTSVINGLSVIVKINSSNFTPFTADVPVAKVPGLSFPQMVAVGDLNTGGTPYSGGNLYPSPVVNGVSTINGPGISGAFVNNTSSGFMIGQNVVGASGNVLYWRAYLYDYSNG